MAKGSNPRRSNGAKRTQLRKRMASQELPCALCGQPIDYTLPAGHPMSFELDEIVPVSRYREGGYETPEECALDPANHQPAHRICNQHKGNYMPKDGIRTQGIDPCVSQVDWIGLYGTK